MTSEHLSSLESLLSARQSAQEELLSSLTEEQVEELLAMLPMWRPQLGPQTLALESQADILGYGGAAGGGKTDLALGIAGTQHHRTIIFRRIFPSLSQLIDRSRELYGAFADYNGSEHAWSFHDGRRVRFGSLQYEENVTDWQGQPHDLYVFEEAPEFTESQFRFVIGWNRTTRANQRCRIVMTFNPPTNSDGEWIIKFFAPWLDKKHPRPARPGELRYFGTNARGEEIEVPDAAPIFVNDALGFVKPLSRTFIPAKLGDNAFLARTNYGATLNAMPEPLRSKMLFGDFEIGREDDAYQVIPTAWILAAQARWLAREKPATAMSAIGVDVARGGKDKTLLAPRHGNWFARLIAYPGTETPDGDSVRDNVRLVRTDDATVNIDIIGVGSSPYDSCRKEWGDKVLAMNAAAKSEATDKSGRLGFVNKRAEWWWSMRENLDPASGQDLALPPDDELKSDLCAPHWKPTPRGIQIESKDEIKDRLHRSPDRGDAVVMAGAIEQVEGASVVEFYRQQLAARKIAQTQPTNVQRTIHDLKGRKP